MKPTCAPYAIPVTADPAIAIPIDELRPIMILPTNPAIEATITKILRPQRSEARPKMGLNTAVSQKQNQSRSIRLTPTE